MTCEDFHACVQKVRQSTDADLGLTRAERMACSKHYRTCPQCHEFTDQMHEEGRRNMTPEAYAAAIAYGVAMAQVDAKDPESGL